ncbi:hypothetical protein [Actinomadura harenae]|uniref:Uncharacterized protein n=1 Tax=Actinomadura harenae TaxID=2483351 RepID=A0A3M2LXX9_9ACTN|nr:hypothetical protein [Actinomadura harenae]RMI41996.1 hypothetical protein EBO15_21210 [Actinomadura harenae]
MAKRTRLLALAGGLDDIGLRARLVENVLKPTILRCWNPDTMGRTISVTCEKPTGGAWTYWLYPGGIRLGDAQDVRDPDDTISTALAIATELAR